jgi:hypothetical protein
MTRVQVSNAIFVWTQSGNQLLHFAGICFVGLVFISGLSSLIISKIYLNSREILRFVRFAEVR